MAKNLNVTIKKDPITGKVINGGVRPGQGRNPGSKNAITIANILREVTKQTNGVSYEEIIIQDFLAARADNDKQLMLKYHNLILNKVMIQLAKIEITDGSEAVQAKQLAFAEALTRLTGVTLNTTPEQERGLLQ